MKNKKEIKEVQDDVYEILTKVMDPELEIDIINLGLVYEITYDGVKTVDILMTLSTPACPLSGAIIANIKESVNAKYADFDVDVELTYDPPWNAEMISDIGKQMLGM